jgi:hypothetical protein
MTVEPKWARTVVSRTGIRVQLSEKLKIEVMANVYVEPRPKGRTEGSPIHDYVVEDHADHVLETFKTQREAIDWARSQGHVPLIARVRVNDKKKPDHWRGV